MVGPAGHVPHRPHQATGAHVAVHPAELEATVGGLHVGERTVRDQGVGGAGKGRPFHAQTAEDGRIGVDGERLPADARHDLRQEGVAAVPIPLLVPRHPAQVLLSEEDVHHVPVVDQVAGRPARQGEKAIHVLQPGRVAQEMVHRDPRPGQIQLG